MLSLANYELHPRSPISIDCYKNSFDILMVTLMSRSNLGHFHWPFSSWPFSLCGECYFRKISRIRSIFWTRDHNKHRFQVDDIELASVGRSRQLPLIKHIMYWTRYRWFRYQRSLHLHLVLSLKANLGSKGSKSWLKQPRDSFNMLNELSPLSSKQPNLCHFK